MTPMNEEEVGLMGPGTDLVLSLSGFLIVCVVVLVPLTEVAYRSLWNAKVRIELAENELDRVGRLRDGSIQTTSPMVRLETQLKQTEDELQKTISKSENLERSLVAAQNRLKSLELERKNIQILNQESQRKNERMEKVLAKLGVPADLDKVSDANLKVIEDALGFRSKFFDALRSKLEGNPNVRIVGDRFVFLAELLFPLGKANLTEKGRQELEELAQILLKVSASFPQDIDWILRVDGHADSVPIRRGSSFADNWELSSERALSVVRYLRSLDVPNKRLAAVGFGETRPISETDLAANRRIEFKLTQP